MNSLLPDNKSWINRILQKDMCKLLLQAAILAINLPFICAVPDGFTIECKHNNILTCQDSICSWNGFNCRKEVINYEKFICLLNGATGQYSCIVDNNNNKESFCKSNEECGFQEGFRNGKCIITRTPGPDTCISQASRDDTNEPQQGKDSVTNNTDDRMNSGASIGKGAITGIVLGVLAIAAPVIGILIYHGRTKWRRRQWRHHYSPATTIATLNR